MSRIAAGMVPLLDDGRTLVITRTLNAPRALVWKMFSDPYHLAQWWGPKGFTNRVEKLDFRTGGSWLHVMIGPDGRELPTTMSSSRSPSRNGSSAATPRPTRKSSATIRRRPSPRR